MKTATEVLDAITEFFNNVSVERIEKQSLWDILTALRDTYLTHKGAKRIGVS